MTVTHDLMHQYSDGITQRKIAVLGPVPPPLGGVAVHIQRVMKKFSNQGNKVLQFNITAEYRYRWLLVYLMRLAWWLMYHRPDYVYYHTLYLSNNSKELSLLAWMKKIIGFKFIAVEHDCRHMYTRSKRYKKKFNNVMQSVDQLVVIGDITHKSYTDNGIVLPQECSVEASFLPPDVVQAPTIFLTYPSSLKAFLAHKRPLIIANAFQLSLLNGKDLYGFDLCLAMVEELKKEYPTIGLVFALAHVGDVAYFKQMYKQIFDTQIQDHIYLLYKQQELWPLMQHADLFVRPTLSDAGASISVHEALHLGVPALASDVCRRPVCAKTFQTGNKHDFIVKVKGELSRLKL